MSNNEAQLWRRGGERVRSREKIDPTYAATQQVLAESHRYGQLTRRKDGLFSDVVWFRPSSASGRKRPAYAEAHLSNKDEMIRIAISNGFDDHGKPVELRSYQMNPQGIVVDLDTMEGLDPASDAGALSDISDALGAIRQHELRQIAEHKERTKRVWHGIGGSAIGLAIASGATLGVYAGVQAWIIEPAERANEYREQFNQNDYALPGEGIDFDYHDFKTIPADEFEAIPFYGGIDQDLASPRLFELDTYGCASITTEVPENGDLFVALPDTSPYVGYHFETSLESDGFSVCLTEDNPLESDADTVEIAVQVR